MNLPNKLTMARILLVPVFMVFASMTRYNTEGYTAAWYLAAGVVFAVASFTDYLDGHLARKWQLITRLWQVCRPAGRQAADHGRLFCNMMRDGVCSPVVLAVILAREFAVSGLRMVAAGAKDGKVIAANMWGKVKTVLQMLSIIFYYFAAALAGPTDTMAVCLISSALCWLVAAVTAISGIKYLVDNRHFINTAK